MRLGPEILCLGLLIALVGCLEGGARKAQMLTRSAIRRFLAETRQAYQHRGIEDQSN